MLLSFFLFFFGVQHRISYHTVLAFFFFGFVWSYWSNVYRSLSFSLLWGLLSWQKDHLFLFFFGQYYMVSTLVIFWLIYPHFLLQIIFFLMCWMKCSRFRDTIIPLLFLNFCFHSWFLGENNPFCVTDTFRHIYMKYTIQTGSFPYNYPKFSTERERERKRKNLWKIC